jgi:hypothetical protein
VAALGSSPLTVPAPAGAADLNHAAVVIDTGDGQVRRYCLAFPEASISGAEALRRLDVDPVFSSYGSKGEAVCSLCGVGCPAGDCFCNAKYWSYHRAGPGGEAYTTSRVGASSTEVRDGDVEGWRWGSGQAPPAATVGQVCDVPEPPARTSASASPSSTTTAPPASTTTAVQAPAGAAPAPPPAGAPSGPAPSPSPTTPAAGPAPAPAPSADPGPGDATVVADATVAPSDPEALGADEVAGDDHAASADDLSSAAPTANRREPEPEGGPAGAVGLAAFVVVLGGVLVWRARLRRPDVRH